MSINADYKSRLRAAQLPLVGTLDTLVAGSIQGGNRFSMANQKPVPGTLAARFQVDVETLSLTMTAIWQVSRDGTTWIRIAASPNNPANVVLGTGTGGADAAVDVVIPAPEAVHGYRFCRAAILTAGATGAAVDTFTIDYDYCEQS